MAVILLPSLLASEAGGQGRFELEAATVLEALQALPIRDLIFDERGELRPLVNVYVDRTQIDDLAAPLGRETEVRLVAAIAGGAEGRLRKGPRRGSRGRKPWRPDHLRPSRSRRT